MSNSNLVVPQLATVEIKGMTRSAFVLRSAMAAGAVYGASVVGPFVSRSFAQDGGGGGDVEILNFALTLEALEATFYQEALRQVSGLSGDLQALAEQLEADESEHAEVLTSTIQDLGGEPVEAPEFDFGEAFSNEDSFLETAQTFEDLGVGAYNGAGPMIEAEEILAAAGSIVQIEGRHAGLIRLQRGEPPAPEAFDMGIPMDEVLDAAMPFIVTEGGGGGGGGGQ